jgi:hypothetical protein
VNKQGEAAFKRLSDVHDVHVLLCPALLSEFNGMKYVYAHTITRQYMLASGAFQIENPDKAADAKATALAGVESVLKTYQAILQQKPDAKAKALDDLLKKQSQGKLKDAFSFPRWIGLMLLGAVLCFYGGLRRSRWFFLPSVAAVLIMAGILVSVYHRE